MVAGRGGGTGEEEGWRAKWMGWRLEGGRRGERLGVVGQEVRKRILNDI